MLYQLPPAGERIVLRREHQGSERLAKLFNPLTPFFYNSGTSALAAAVKAAISVSRIASPEVIMPAYGCPDLISAVLCVGGRPRLVDLAAERPWLDLVRLRAAIGPETAAVVAVDLFGIPERYSEIRGLLRGRNVQLIQDSAQALPKPSDPQWQGDYVVLSFGRGKPVSLLHGGAVLLRNPDYAAALPHTTGLVQSGFTCGVVLPGSSVHSPLTSSDVFRFRLKALAYNLLISPRMYWLLARLPFLGLGETLYEPLDSTVPVDPILGDFLSENVNAYWCRLDTVQAKLTALLADVGKGHLLDLFTACRETDRTPKLLRYPVLVADPALRDRLFHALDREGLGVSKMYPVTLPYIRGLENHLRVAGESYPNAEAFARRILTFPIHSQVREHDLLRMHACIRAVIGH